MAWQKFGDEMSRAKVLRRLSKRLPMRPDDDAALAAADAVEFYQLQAAAEQPRQPTRATVPLAAVKRSANQNRGHDGANPAHVEPEPEAKPAAELPRDEMDGDDPSDESWWASDSRGVA
jgi:hypothetical protein